MKKIVFSIYYENADKIHINYAIRFLCDVFKAKMIEIIPETEIENQFVNQEENNNERKFSNGRKRR